MLRPFAVACMRRMINGALTYGDTSLERHPVDLLRELEQELIDQPSWSYLCWRRIAHLRRLLERATTCPLCGAPCEPVKAAREEEVVL